MGKDKTQKFEEKFKIFENLNTFVDIKDYLKQLNVLNADTNRASFRLPPLKIDEVKDYVIPNQYTGNPASAKARLSPKQSPFATRLLDSESYTGLKSVSNKSPGSFGERVKTIRKNVSQYIPIKPTEESPKPGKERRDTYSKILDCTNIMLTQLNEADTKVSVEDGDADTFYQALQADLANNNFERMDYGHVEVRQDEIDYYKNLLALKEEKDNMDQQYYMSYRSRADKVIRLLRKATKNIFNKNYDKRKNFRLGEEGNVSKRGAGNDHTLDSDIREECKQQIETFLTSSDLWDDKTTQGINANLNAHFFNMLQKINSLNQTSTNKKQKSKFLIDGEEDDLENKKNHAITKVYKGYMKTIIACAEAQESKFKTSKEDIKKDINKLGAAYTKDMEKYGPKTLQSIRMTLDVHATSKAMVDKPVNKHLSRKTLNALTD